MEFNPGDLVKYMRPKRRKYHAVSNPPPEVEIGIVIGFDEAMSLYEVFMADGQTSYIMEESLVLLLKKVKS